MNLTVQARTIQSERVSERGKGEKKKREREQFGRLYSHLGSSRPPAVRTYFNILSNNNQGITLGLQGVRNGAGFRVGVSSRVHSPASSSFSTSSRACWQAQDTCGTVFSLQLYSIYPPRTPASAGKQSDRQQSSRKCIPFTTTNCNNVVPERSGSGKSLWVFRFRTVPAAHTRLTYRKHRWSDSTSPHLVYMMEKLAILRCAPLTYCDRNLSR